MQLLQSVRNNGAGTIIITELSLQNLYSAQIQASSNQRRWRIARWGTWLTGMDKPISVTLAPRSVPRSATYRSRSSHFFHTRSFYSATVR